MAEQGARVLWALDYLRNYGRPPADFLAEGFEARQAEAIGGTGGVFKGNDALRAVLTDLAEHFNAVAFDFGEPTEKSDGSVAIVVRLASPSASGDGDEFAHAVSWLWTFEGDSATHLQVFEDPEGALRA